MADVFETESDTAPPTATSCLGGPPLKLFVQSTSKSSAGNLVPPS